MLQNRVDPFGNIITTAARGSIMGNRGVIHNAQKEIVRSFKLKAWICCRLAFKGRYRKVMTADRWTELFFLDEATAFAAGHRPCAECRREDFNRFKSFWLIANPQYGFTEKTSIKDIDEVLHAERINADKTKISFKVRIDTIPDAAFVTMNNNAYLVKNKKLYLWSVFGYEKGIAMPTDATVSVLTPKSVVKTFSAGYQPQISLPSTLH